MVVQKKVKGIKQKKQKSPITCAREILNFSSVEVTDRFDKPRFNSDKLLNKLSIYSPKLVALLNKIEDLDYNDYKKDRKVYKHFIFSDLKKGYGAKIISSAMIAAGYSLVMKNKGTSIILDEKLLNNDDEAKFAVLSSTALWNTPVNQKTTKEILKVFNARPENVHGDQIRFIILDSGFKEGIDLFDVKYAHIFEEQLTDADLTQAVGRGTRFCGQLSLPFKKGWKLQVFNYKSYRTTPRDFKKLKFFKGKESILDYLKNQNKDLKFNVNFENNITKLIKDSSVDKLLNENINNLKKETNKLKEIAKIVIPVTALIVGAIFLKL